MLDGFLTDLSVGACLLDRRVLCDVLSINICLHMYVESVGNGCRFRCQKRYGFPLVVRVVSTNLV